MVIVVMIKLRPLMELLMALMEMMVGMIDGDEVGGNNYGDGEDNGNYRVSGHGGGE